MVLCPMKQLQLLLIAGHPTATDNRCFVWPMSATDSVSPSHIHTVTSAVKTVNNDARFVLLAFVYTMCLVMIKYDRDEMLT